mgnify:CR=1 FL=1
MQSGDTYTTTLKHYASDTKAVTTLRTETGTGTCQLVRDSDNSILTAITGDKILMYSMKDDSLLGEYGSSELGGVPTNIAISSVSGDDGKTSSGCDVSGGGILLLLIGAMIFRKR